MFKINERIVEWSIDDKKTGAIVHKKVEKHLDVALLAAYRLIDQNLTSVPRDVLEMESKKFDYIAKGDFNKDYFDLMVPIVKNVRSQLDYISYMKAYSEFSASIVNSLLDETSMLARNRPALVESLIRSIFADLTVVMHSYIEGLNTDISTERDRQAAIDNARTEDLNGFIRAVGDCLENLAAGDLTGSMEQPIAAEFEPIRTKFNQAVTQLDVTIGSVIGAVNSMQGGLNQITAAAGELSQRTEQQAASLEETVSALSEVVKGVNLTAHYADDARAAALIAQTEAKKGEGVVSQAVSAMAEIKQSSENIERIIGVIDQIAFQTNLLALNAGVEAARAGDAGRGFAVVAQEVRGLAQRSAEAAKEIKTLISTSTAQVAHGVGLVSASGHNLAQIVTQVGGVTGMIAKMADSAREQSLSLKEVATAADQMDKVTQRNAAMVEETTAATQSLLGETEQLAGLVSNFQTKQGRPRAGKSSEQSRAPTPHPHSVVRMRAVGSHR
ncbi:methyl-accepting chemotaxis protein [Rhizobium sp. PP-CC-3A-592]|nr:methyl-accepting chemotaxis protein [Rhizobium sp. PP-CC-3A-592]